MSKTLEKRIEDLEHRTGDPGPGFVLAVVRGDEVTLADGTGRVMTRQEWETYKQTCQGVKELVVCREGQGDEQADQEG